MSTSTSPQSRGDVGKTSVKTSAQPKVMTGNQILKGKCSFTGCPYEDNSELATTMGVVQIKGTNYIFHPDCHAKWIATERSQVRRDEAERIEALKASEAREVTLVDAKK